jgi:hypothetical protein
LLSLFRTRLIDVIRDVAPVVGLVVILQIVLVGAPLALFLQFVLGTVVLVLGLAVFFVGLDLGVLSIGRLVGADLPKRGSLSLIVAVAFALGFATTVAEPDVLVLAAQVDEASKGAIGRQTLVIVISVGLAAFTALALARVVLGFSMRVLLTVTIAAMLVLAFLAPSDFLPLAFDAGSVTTGVVASPVIIALAVGLATVLAGRSPLTDGFGLLGVASLGAVIAVLLMAILW